MSLFTAPLAKLVRTYYGLRMRFVDLNSLRYFLVFVGNPRSGTTLVRSLLDAHPNIAISNEVDVIRRIKAGEGWPSVAGRILVNRQAFQRKPEWTGYSYAIRKKIHPADETIRVLGDKKAEVTPRALVENFSLVNRLIEWSPVPVRFMHCVRNPFDVIATKTQRNAFDLKQNIQIYFQHEKLAAHLGKKFGPENYHRLHLEGVIADSYGSLRGMVQFLGLTAEEDYLRACQALVFNQPHKSRQSVEWSAEALREVQRQVLLQEHLQYYVDQGQVSF